MTTLPPKYRQEKDNASPETALSNEDSKRHSEPGHEPEYKIALVCDWLTTPGGAEKVLLELHRMYPDAPIYTSQYSKKGINWFDDAEVKTGWLQIFPKSLRKVLGPLRQIYFSHLDLSDYDLVISVTGAEAKAVRTVPKSQRRNQKLDKNNLSSETALFDDKSNWSLEVGHLSPRKGSTHVCFCHVPTQYYWQMYDKYLENPGFGILNPLIRLCFKLLVKPLRKADYRAAQQPDQFITISTYAQQQIKKYYHRDAIIVAPPVETDKFKPNPQTFPQQTTKLSTSSPQVNKELSTNSSDLSTNPKELSTDNTQVLHRNSTINPQESSHFSTESQDLSTSYPQREGDLSTGNHELFHNFSTTFPQYRHSSDRPNQRPEIICPNPPVYYIIACRQVTWKRVDLAIKACQQLSLPLLVVGDGPEHANLLKLTHDNSSVKFLPWAKTWELARYLQGAKGYIFPSLEPFGIAAVEALAAGCPVIAYREGGSQDFIKNGKNGLLFDHQTVDSLAEALRKFQYLDFDRQTIIKSAADFSVSRFRQGITSAVQVLLQPASPQNCSPQSSPSQTHSPHSTKQNRLQNHPQPSLKSHQKLTKKD